MYKNQLQELAQRSCFNLPSYTCIREGPDHAPRFKATVNFNGETYESPNYSTTLRLAEHSAAEIALNQLASHGPSNSLAARILDETGVYKNLLQEVSQRVGASLPTYTTFRSGLGHLPVFTCTVELAGCIFTGEPAKNKKQAEKNAAMSAWLSLKLLTQKSENLPLQKGNTEEQEHVIVARALQKFRLKARMSNVPFPIHFPVPKPNTLSGQPSTTTTSKILPLICPKTGPSRRQVTTLLNKPQTPIKTPQNQFLVTTADEPPQSPSQSAENTAIPCQQKFPAVGATPYIPVCHFRAHHGVAAPVTIRNSIPVFSAPPSRVGVAPQLSNHLSPQFGLPPHMGSGVAPPVTIRQAVPVFSALPKTVTSSTTATEVKRNTSFHGVSKSTLEPLATTPSSCTEDKGSDAGMVSITEQVPDEEASKFIEPVLKGLEI